MGARPDQNTPSVAASACECDSASCPEHAVGVRCRPLDFATVIRASELTVASATMGCGGVRDQARGHTEVAHATLEGCPVPSPPSCRLCHKTVQSWHFGSGPSDAPRPRRARETGTVSPGPAPPHQRGGSVGAAAARSQPASEPAYALRSIDIEAYDHPAEKLREDAHARADRPSLRPARRTGRGGHLAFVERVLPCAPTWVQASLEQRQRLR
jgi:hypothetical protein